MPEHESVYQVIVSKRAAQQLVEHAAFAAGLEERLGYQLKISAMPQILCSGSHIAILSCAPRCSPLKNIVKWCLPSGIS